MLHTKMLFLRNVVPQWGKDNLLKSYFGPEALLNIKATFAKRIDINPEFYCLSCALNSWCYNFASIILEYSENKVVVGWDTIF